MAEGLESGAAMVAAHAALAHTAEGHGAGGQVDDGVIDASAAKMAMLQDPPLGLFVFAETYRARGWGCSSTQRIAQSTKSFEAACFPKDSPQQPLRATPFPYHCIIRQHRQDRAKDFFSHHGIRPVHVRHHRGSDPQCFSSYCPPQTIFPDPAIPAVCENAFR